MLGCTHYPFAAAYLQERVGPAVRLLDTGEPVARHTHQLLIARHIALRPEAEHDEFGQVARLTLVSSGSPQVLQAAVARWLGDDLPVQRSA